MYPFLRSPRFTHLLKRSDFLSFFSNLPCFSALTSNAVCHLREIVAASSAGVKLWAWICSHRPYASSPFKHLESPWRILATGSVCCGLTLHHGGFKCFSVMLGLLHKSPEQALHFGLPSSYLLQNCALWAQVHGSLALYASCTLQLCTP